MVSRVGFGRGAELRVERREDVDIGVERERERERQLELERTDWVANSTE